MVNDGPFSFVIFVLDNKNLAIIEFINEIFETMGERSFIFILEEILKYL